MDEDFFEPGRNKINNIYRHQFLTYTKIASLGSQVGLRRKTVIYHYEILRSGVRLAPGRYFFLKFFWLYFFINTPVLVMIATSLYT